MYYVYTIYLTNLHGIFFLSAPRADKKQVIRLTQISEVSKIRLE